MALGAASAMAAIDMALYEPWKGDYNTMISDYIKENNKYGFKQANPDWEKPIPDKQIGAAQVGWAGRSLHGNADVVAAKFIDMYVAMGQSKIAWPDNAKVISIAGNADAWDAYKGFFGLAPEFDPILSNYMTTAEFGKLVKFVYDECASSVNGMWQGPGAVWHTFEDWMNILFGL